MSHQTTPCTDESSVNRETLEAWARERIQTFLQALLEEEVTAFLGRRKSERRAAVDARPGYRNGYGKLRRLSLTSGTITVHRPRVRGLEERFDSRLLPLFNRRTREVGDLLPTLYLHGLAQGDFELALRGLPGDGAPLSSSSLQRLRAKWDADYEAWRTRDLHDRELVYLWADGLYVKAGLEKEKAALLIVIGALRDGTKEILAVESGARESTESWRAVLRSLQARGLPSPRLTIVDGHLGIRGALAEIYPASAEQQCWNHKLLNVLDQLPRRIQPQARALLSQLPYAETRAEGERLKRQVVARYGRAYPKAAESLERDWERMVTFYRFPREHWKHLRTTNVVESPFAAVRLRTDAAKRYKRVANATALIWKVLMVAQSRFRRLDAPELLAEVYHGISYVDGRRLSGENTRRVAA
ncbi:MAG: IS256 family transposase [Candidatus Rokubacteria bacterium]|nr:IS256 family transposase [Candidatus Rokubacteria bacterium]